MDQLSRHDQPVVADERFTRGAHSFLAVLGQWDVRRACMFAGERPFGLAVSDDETAWCGHLSPCLVLSCSCSCTCPLLLLFRAQRLLLDTS